MRNANFVGLLFAATLAIVAAVEVPEFIHVCKRNNPNMEACITESVEYLRPYLTKGVPEYNIPSLEPLLLKELVAAQGSGIKVTAKEVRAYGSSNFRVTNMKLDIDTLVFRVNIDIPNIYIDGFYDVNGKVLLLPITGSGPMNGNFTNCRGAVVFKASVVNENDVDHLKINEFKLSIAVGKGTLRLENLFGGDKVLGDVVNSAINNNFDAFIKELKPLIEKALADAFLKIANSIVDQFTYQQLFPED